MRKENVVVSFRVTPEVFDGVKEVLKGFDMPLATFLKLCIKKAIRDGNVDFLLEKTQKD